MKILVTGITGQVGWELMRSLQPLGEVIGVNSQQMNLADPDAIREVVRAVQPDLIVNPAAYTAVDKAETEPELAMQINGIAPGILAEEAKRLGAPLIHYSTDYVFDGSKDSPYSEDDATNPQSVYGRSKCAGEEAITAAGGDTLILRTSWVYASRGKNFLKTILRLAQEREELRIVADQIGAPTSARLIADTTAQLAQQFMKEREAAGIYHLSGSGSTSWHGFATFIVEEAKKQIPQRVLKVQHIEAIPSSAYPLPATRPANSRLALACLQSRFGVRLPRWESGVALCLTELN